MKEKLDKRKPSQGAETPSETARTGPEQERDRLVQIIVDLLDEDASIAADEAIFASNLSDADKVNLLLGRAGAVKPGEVKNGLGERQARKIEDEQLARVRRIMTEVEKKLGDDVVKEHGSRSWVRFGKNVAFFWKILSTHVETKWDSQLRSEVRGVHRYAAEGHPLPIFLDASGVLPSAGLTNEILNRIKDELSTRLGLANRATKVEEKIDTVKTTLTSRQLGDVKQRAEQRLLELFAQGVEDLGGEQQKTRENQIEYLMRKFPHLQSKYSEYRAHSLDRSGEEVGSRGVLEAIETNNDFPKLRETMGRMRSLFPDLTLEQLSQEFIRRGAHSSDSKYWLQGVLFLATFSQSERLQLKAKNDDALKELKKLSLESSADIKIVLQAAQAFADRLEKLNSIVGYPPDVDVLDTLILLSGQSGDRGEKYMRALVGELGQDFLSFYFSQKNRENVAMTTKNNMQDITSVRDALRRELKFIDALKRPTSTSDRLQAETDEIKTPEVDPTEVGDWFLTAANFKELFALCKDPKKLQLIKQRTGLDITQRDDFQKFVAAHFLQNPVSVPDMSVFDDAGNLLTLQALIKRGQISGNEWPIDQLFWLLISSSSVEEFKKQLAATTKDGKYVYAELLGYRTNVRESIDANETAIFEAGAIVDHLFGRLRLILGLKELFASEGLKPGLTYNELEGLIKKIKDTLGDRITSNIRSLTLLFSGLSPEELMAEREGLPENRKNILALWQVRSPVALDSFLREMKTSTSEFEDFLQDIQRYRELKAQTSSGSSGDYLEAV